MTFIDLSDAEGVLGLLVDLVADETSSSHGDPDRHRFLSDLLAQLQALEQSSPELAPRAVIRRLRDLRRSADPAFANDTVVVHIRDCIEELERIDRDQ